MLQQGVKSTISAQENRTWEQPWVPLCINYSALFAYLIDLGKIASKTKSDKESEKAEEQKIFAVINNLASIYNTLDLRNIYFSLIIFYLTYLRYISSCNNGLKEEALASQNGLSNNLNNDDEQAFFRGLCSALIHYSPSNSINTASLNSKDAKLLKAILASNDKTKEENTEEEHNNENYRRTIIRSFANASMVLDSHTNFGQWVAYGFGKFCAYLYALGCLAVDILALRLWLLGLGCTFWPLIICMVVFGGGVLWLNYSAVCDLVPMRIQTFFTLLSRGELWRRFKSIIFESEDGKPNKIFRSIVTTIFMIMCVGAAIVLGVMAYWYMLGFLVAFCCLNLFVGVVLSSLVGLFLAIASTVLFLESVVFFLNSKWFKEVSNYLCSLTGFKFYAVCLLLIFTMGLALFGLYCLSSSGQASVQNVVSSFASQSVANGLGVTSLVLAFGGQALFSAGTVVQFVKDFKFELPGWKGAVKIFWRLVGCVAEFGLAVNGETISSEPFWQYVGGVTASGQDYLQFVINDESINALDPEQYNAVHKKIFLDFINNASKIKTDAVATKNETSADPISKALEKDNKDAYVVDEQKLEVDVNYAEFIKLRILFFAGQNLDSKPDATLCDSKEASSVILEVKCPKN